MFLAKACSAKASFEGAADAPSVNSTVFSLCCVPIGSEMGTRSRVALSHCLRWTRPHPPDLTTCLPPDARCSRAVGTLLRSKRNSRGGKKPDALPHHQLNQPPVRSHVVRECCFGPAAVFPLVFFAPTISTFHQRNLIRAFADLQCFPSLLSNRPPASGCGAWSTSTTSSALCTSASGSERTFKPCCRVLVGLLPILAYA